MPIGHFNGPYWKNKAIFRCFQQLATLDLNGFFEMKWHKMGPKPHLACCRNFRETGTPSVRRIRQFVVFQMPGESKANVVPIKVRLFTMTIKELEAEYNFVSGLT